MHKTAAVVVLAGMVAAAGADDAPGPEQDCIPGEAQWEEVVRTFGRAQEFRAVLDSLAESDERVAHVETIRRQAREEGTPLWETDAGVLGLQVLKDFHRTVWAGGEWAAFAAAMDDAMATEVCERARVRLPQEVWFWRNVKHAYGRVAELRRSITEEFEVDEWYEIASRRQYDLLMGCAGSEKALALSCPAAARVFREGSEWVGEAREKYGRLYQALRRVCPWAWGKFSRWCPAGALVEAGEESSAAFAAWIERMRDLDTGFYDALREEIPAWQRLSRAMRAGGGAISFDDAVARRKEEEAGARERLAILRERWAAAELRRQKEAEGALKDKEAIAPVEAGQAPDSIRRREAERALQEAIAREARQLEQEHLALLDAGRVEYIAQIKDKIERNWLRPPGTALGLKCVVRVSQIPGGEVVQAEIRTSSGNVAFDRSVEEAVLSSSPLPVPKDPSLFDRHIVITFEPVG